MKRHNIDINCDLGEGKTIEDCAMDEQLMPYISRCNIACGGHAGNNATMRETLKNAQQHGVKCGAHPGYPDLENFGRASLKMGGKQLLTSIWGQIQQLDFIAHELDQPLEHIKLHGALYNDVEKSPELANALCQFFAEHYAHFTLVGLAGGAMEIAATQCELTFLREGFIDRAYLKSKQLAPRSMQGAVYSNAQQCINQVLALVNKKPFTTLDGERLVLEVDTLCLHGDSLIALEVAKGVYSELNHQGCQLR